MNSNKIHKKSKVIHLTSVKASKSRDKGNFACKLILHFRLCHPASIMDKTLNPRTGVVRREIKSKSVRAKSDKSKCNYNLKR